MVVSANTTLKGQRLQTVPLSAFSAALIVKTYAEHAGLDRVQFADHLAALGLPHQRCRGECVVDVQYDGVSRYKSVDTARGYLRRADLFYEHAGAAFL
jgi:hypothetical protein